MRIVDTRPTPGAEPGPAAHDYYVHYKGKNRRLDEWVTWDQVGAG